MDELKKDIRCDIAEDVKTIVIETMKEENEKKSEQQKWKRHRKASERIYKYCKN